MKLPNECRSIEEVRQEIDEIDHAIISLIGKRLSFIQEIVKYKSDVDEVYSKKRHLEVINERREFAANLHLDPDVIESVYLLLMDYFIKEQLELFKNKQK